MEIRVLLIDNQEIILSGVRSLLADTTLHLVGTASDELSAFSITREKKPEIVLWDAHMPTVSGFDFLNRYQREFPRTKIVVFTNENNTSIMPQCFLQGVKDYILKSISAQKLMISLQNVYYGTNHSENPEWIRMQNARSLKEVLEAPASLTSREEQVLQHIVLGMSNKEIAKALQISTETVKDHIHRIFQKLGVQDRTQAAVWAVQRKFGG